MPAVVKIKLSELDEDWIAALKQEHQPDAILEVHISTNEDTVLATTTFWEVIAALDWTALSNQEVLEPAVEHLSTLSVPEIYAFQERLAQKLYQLDTPAHARAIGDAAYKEGAYFSVDNFLYARACVVAHGEEVFKEVVENPMEMPKDLVFEPLLRLASTAYQQKTQKTFLYLPTVSYETYSNQIAWQAK